MTKHAIVRRTPTSKASQRLAEDINTGARLLNGLSTVWVI